MERLEEAIEMLRREYESVREQQAVYDPLVYALFRTWKYFDEQRRQRLYDE